MRMLEIYSSNAYVGKYIPEEPTTGTASSSRTYLEAIFCYLIRQKYFRIVRRLIEEKIPPVDEDTTTIPNPIAEALLQMLLRPLKLLPTANETFNAIILQSFSFHILSPDFSAQIKHYIVPALAASTDFPYISLVRFIAEEYQGRLDYQNTILVDIDDEMDGGGVTAESTPVSKKARKNPDQESLQLSSSLLYSVMKLGENQFGKICLSNLYNLDSMLSLNSRQTKHRRVVQRVRQGALLDG